MALAKESLQADIENILEQLKTEENQSVAIKKFALLLATAIDKYVKTGIVTIPAGVPVATTGTAAAQAGATTSAATGAIS